MNTSEDHFEPATPGRFEATDGTTRLTRTSAIVVERLVAESLAVRTTGVGTGATLTLAGIVRVNWPYVKISNDPVMLPNSSAVMIGVTFTSADAPGARVPAEGNATSSVERRLNAAVAVPGLARVIVNGANVLPTPVKTNEEMFAVIGGWFATAAWVTSIVTGTFNGAPELPVTVRVSL